MMIMQSKLVCPKILRDPYLHFLKIHFLAFYWEKHNCFIYEGLKMILNKHFSRQKQHNKMAEQVYIGPNVYSDLISKSSC